MTEGEINILLVTPLWWKVVLPQIITKFRKYSISSPRQSFDLSNQMYLKVVNADIV